VPELRLIHADSDPAGQSIDVASAILEWVFTRHEAGWVTTEDCPDIQTASTGDIHSAADDLADSGYVDAQFDGGARYPHVKLLSAGKREVQQGIDRWNEPGRAPRELTQLILTIAYRAHTDDDGVILMSPPAIREGRVIQPTDRQHQAAAQWLAARGYIMVQRDESRITQGTITKLGIDAAESPMPLHEYDIQRRGTAPAPVYVRVEGSANAFVINSTGDVSQTTESVSVATADDFGLVFDTIRSEASGAQLSVAQRTVVVEALDAAEAEVISQQPGWQNRAKQALLNAPVQFTTTVVAALAPELARRVFGG